MSKSAGTSEPRPKGRPAKTQKTVSVLEKHGVVDNPKSSENQLEFAYEKPLLFKNLFKFFGNLKASMIFIRCTPTEMTFFTRDLNKKCRVIAKLPGSQVNWYYCEKTFWMGVIRTNVEKIFSRIDKSLYKISIIKTHDNDDQIEIIFKDAELDKDCNYKISLSKPDDDEELFATEKTTSEESLNGFPVAFTLKSAQIKKSVLDISELPGNEMTIEKIGDYPLRFTHNSANVTYNETYRSSEKINLVSTVEKEKIFRATVKTTSLKSFVNASIAQEVRIYCKAGDSIVFHSELDALIVDTVVDVE